MILRCLAFIILAAAAFAADTAGPTRNLEARSVVIEEGKRLCGACKVPLLQVEGFTDGPEIRSEPVGVPPIVRFVYRYDFPNPHPWFAHPKKEDPRDVPFVYEYCGSCDSKLAEKIRQWQASPPSSEEFQKLLKRREELEKKSNQ